MPQDTPKIHDFGSLFISTMWLFKFFLVKRTMKQELQVEETSGKRDQREFYQHTLLHHQTVLQYTLSPLPIHLLLIFIILLLLLLILLLLLLFKEFEKPLCHIVPFGKFHRIGGAPPDTCPNELSMMPLKRWVVTENVWTVLLGNEVWSKLLM